MLPDLLILAALSTTFLALHALVWRWGWLKEDT